MSEAFQQQNCSKYVNKLVVGHVLTFVLEEIYNVEGRLTKDTKEFKAMEFQRYFIIVVHRVFFKIYFC